MLLKEIAVIEKFEDETFNAKRVSCWPRPAIEKMTPPTNAVLISIYDKRDSPLEPPPGWGDVLKLRFHDTDGSQGGLEVFNDEQATQILEFVLKNAAADEIVVHCAAGQSRSAAVAVFLGDVLGLPAFRQTTPIGSADPFYNRKVYRTLTNVFAGNPYAA